ncbi:Bug family tripartite tricarboxylate transporter substrate binding protein [Rhodoplanes sp. Z2-YC6860]|uniref:Bug family tripartite tricarboxylate transporter substrate binding protein n=1 Tax=Rhodoplanes sp. Z2-YC6860 TaxID=674703 RepID=UPI00078BCA32|nr:tripartite tricarboxylate transporter substrate binding protein [Rhodoplanes sp. Z2-YC6860]AMN41644.1 extra-cytoplasmic solute receptor protein [Rhodoplanes sp. Z2-YC6860]
MTAMSSIVLRLTTAVVLACAIAQSSLALDYPTKPVRLIVGVAAGGANDTVARMVAQALTDRLGQPVVVENRPGAGGNIGLEAVANAVPDGHTLLFVTSANALSAAFYSTANVNFARDIAPVASLVRGALIMEVNPSFPAKTIPEFIAYAKANPGKINMASAGIGNTTHVSGELFMMLTGTKFTHVPYRGGAPAVADLIGGQVQLYFDGISASLEHVRSGKLHALGVTTAQRSDVLPDVPAIAEFVPGYEAAGWYGIGVPKNVSAEIVDKLNKEINASLADPKLKTRLADLGYATSGGSPAEFQNMIAQEIDKWAKVIKFAGIRPD